MSREQVAAASSSQGQPTTLAQGAGAGLGGGVVGAIIASGAGEVLFIDYASEKAFAATLKIVDR